MGVYCEWGDSSLDAGAAKKSASKARAGFVFRPIDDLAGLRAGLA